MTDALERLKENDRANYARIVRLAEVYNDINDAIAALNGQSDGGSKLKKSESPMPQGMQYAAFLRYYTRRVDRLIATGVGRMGETSRMRPQDLRAMERRLRKAIVS